MFLQDLIDGLTIIFMFVLRIGVPLAVTLAFGYWLEKKLAPREEIQAPKEEQNEPRWSRSGKIIQMHCWDLKRCEPATRAHCAAFKHPDLPCWLALQVEGDKVQEACFTCALYKPQAIAA